MIDLVRHARRVLLLALPTVLVVVHAASAAPFDDCSEHLPFGVPTLTTSAPTTPVCHVGYAVLHDDKLLVPRWVAYRLTGPHTHGCIDRTNNFHGDDNLPAGRRAMPSDYEGGTGFDQGHQAPAQDFGFNLDRMKDSFSMANMTPQLPGFNRQQWERLEETVRAYATERGEVIVYVGPIVLNTKRTIGKNKVVVPGAFWKVIVDPARKEAVGFVLPHRNIAKGKLEPFQESIAHVEDTAKVRLPLPSGIDRNVEPPLWTADLAKWRADQARMCPPKKKKPKAKGKKKKKRIAAHSFEGVAYVRAFVLARPGAARPTA